MADEQKHNIAAHVYRNIILRGAVAPLEQVVAPAAARSAAGGPLLSPEEGQARVINVLAVLNAICFEDHKVLGRPAALHLFAVFDHGVEVLDKALPMFTSTRVATRCPSPRP